MNPIGLQKKLDDLVNLVGSLTKTTKEKHVDSPHFRVAAPPYRSSPSLDGRPSIGSSFGSVSYDSPLGPTPSHLSQPLASPGLDPASEILEEKRIRKKRSPEPETECIHFVDVNDITDNEDFFEDETEAIKLGSLHDLNPALGEVEPLNFNALVNPKSNPIKDIPLDKVYLNDINLISKETDLTLSTMKLNSKDSDLIITSTGLTSHNSELILDNSDYDLDNLELGVTQENFLLDLHPDLSGPESIDLRIITKSDPIENINTLLEDINLTLNNSELNLEDEHPKFLLESILGVAPLDLHLKECVSPDLTYLNNPCTDLNESISPYLPAASLTVVPAFVLETLPHLLSPIPAGDSLCYPIIVMSHDPSSYHTPESYIFPATSSTFPIKDHLSPSWLTLLDYTTATGRLSMTLVETSYRNALHVAFASYLYELLKKIARLIEQNDNNYRLQAEFKQRFKTFEVGNSVMVRIRPAQFPQGTVMKLHARSAGSFKTVKEINDNAYVMDLLAEFNIHSFSNIEDLVTYEGPELKPQIHFKLSLV
ncbi:hypothetical protein M5K25_010750 [Dendrobium thyrsiflorum]|uniref:Tf2-1-like SH3-like domain-containing protein n=1 Tax=Dendrobium thyrsiflorum TaxID=117978 RepID=A0ABD0V812_DENTH